MPLGYHLLTELLKEEAHVDPRSPVNDPVRPCDDRSPCPDDRTDRGEADAGEEMTCHDCAHGLIRVERTKDWNYESCALGYFHEPHACRRPICQDYTPATPEQREARAYRNLPTIIWGPPMEYPE